MPVEIAYTGDPVTEAELGRLEQERGIVLPSDYRTFLLQYNGGVPYPNVFPFKWGKNDAYAHTGRFLGLSYPAALFSFEWNTRVQERISTRFFIISKDHFHSLFHLVCIVVEGDEYGSIYYLPQYEGKENLTPEEYEKFTTDYPSAYWVADSFTEFMTSLVEPPPGVFE